MTSSNTGTVAAIAVKRAHEAPLELVGETSITVDGGIEGNVRQSAHRRVTLISKLQWEEVQAEMEMELPWTTRRANILVDGLDLAPLIGKQIRIGTAEFTINGETEPCGQMDAILPGLQEALKPDCRGGVYGSVTTAGIIQVHDTIEAIE